MNSYEPAITASDLAKSFRDNIAVNGLDLSLPRGSVYGLIARRQLMEKIVAFLGEGGERTVLFSTHIIGDLERVAEYVGIMARGRMPAAGRLEDLQSGMRRVQVIFNGPSVPEGFRIPGPMRSKAEGSDPTSPIPPADVDKIHPSPSSERRWWTIAVSSSTHD